MCLERRTSDQKSRGEVKLLQMRENSIVFPPTNSRCNNNPPISAAIRVRIPHAPVCTIAHLLKPLRLRVPLLVVGAPVPATGVRAFRGEARTVETPRTEPSDAIAAAGVRFSCTERLASVQTPGG